MLFKNRNRIIFIFVSSHGSTRERKGTPIRVSLSAEIYLLPYRGRVIDGKSMDSRVMYVLVKHEYREPLLQWGRWSRELQGTYLMSVIG